MNEGHQTQSVEHDEGEIELIDILRVSLKWKYLIISGPIVCGLLAAIISFNMAKIYSIDVVLRPGILSIEKAGVNIFNDSAQNIKALIDSGTFNNDILDYLKKIKLSNIPKILEFKVTISGGSDSIKVQYETDDIKQGMVIQDRLCELLLKYYAKTVEYYKKEYDIKIASINSDMIKLISNISKKENEIFSIKIDSKNKLNQKDNHIAVLTAEIEARKDQIENENQRIASIEAEIVRISKNTDLLIEERNKFLASTINEDNILSSVIYSNTIQQNIGYLNSLRNEINNVNHRIYQERLGIAKAVNSIKNVEGEKENLIKQTQYKVEKIESEIKEVQSDKNYMAEDIKNLQFKKDSVQNIQILQSATSSPDPIKPKKKLIVILASFLGIFIMVFLSFLLEYISKNKMQKSSNNRARY
jgi:LPS O-antigen subunit length determinant protein (WzzB/FepE family)